MEKKKEKRVKTPEFRVSFPHIFEAHSGFEGQGAKFSVVMLFDKKTDITPLKKAVAEAATAKWGDKTKWPKNLRLPFRDGDEKSDLSGYSGTIFCSASSKQRPGVVDKHLAVITDESDFYAGCYARATVTAFAYDKAGNKGVSFSLQNLQKLRDGQAFSGRKKAEDDFEAYDDGSDDVSNYSNDDASLGL